MLTPYEEKMRISDYDEKLKPCPFCGGKATMIQTKDGIRQCMILCTHCKGASGGMVIEANKEFATNFVIDSWNTRNIVQS